MFEYLLTLLTCIFSYSLLQLQRKLFSSIATIVLSFLVFLIHQLTPTQGLWLLAHLANKLILINLFILQGALHLNDTVVPQPHLLHLSAERLSRDGAFLMDCGSVRNLNAFPVNVHIFI